MNSVNKDSFNHSLKPNFTSNKQNNNSNNKLNNTELFSVEELRNYYQIFSEKYTDIIKNINIIACDTSNNKEYDLRNKTIKELEDKINELKLNFENNSMFLVSYDKQSYSKQLEDLDRDMIALKDKLNPKKKFKFSNKIKNNNNNNNKVDENCKISSNQNTCFDSIISKEDMVINNINNNKLSINNNNNKKNLFLENIKDSNIFILFSFKALFAKNISNSNIYIGSISGGSHLTDISSSIVNLATHQLRIHNSTDTRYNIIVNSNPIIENCKNLVFCDMLLCVKFNNIDKILEQSNIDKNNNKYKNVQDFQWLKNEKSPNYSILETNKEALVNLDNLK